MKCDRKSGPKLVFRLDKSQCFKSCKSFVTESECTDAFFDICIFCSSLRSGWLILCTWLANGMLWSGQLVHPEIWLASSVHMAGQWDALDWSIS